MPATRSLILALTWMALAALLACITKVWIVALVAICIATVYGVYRACSIGPRDHTTADRPTLRPGFMARFGEVEKNLLPRAREMTTIWITGSKAPSLVSHIPGPGAAGISRVESFLLAGKANKKTNTEHRGSYRCVDLFPIGGERVRDDPPGP